MSVGRLRVTCSCSAADFLCYMHVCMQGDVLHGRLRHGRGKHTCSNGDVYEGQWSYDKRQGQGRLVVAATGFTYEGDWKDDVASG